MQILINNHLAVIKEGSSFDFVFENSLFTGSDSYTLTMTFPLRDCPENLAIFGHIDRFDVTAVETIFDCEIRHRDFVRSGSAVITGIDDVEVKVQFLEGRSAQNYYSSLDDVYINELDLGRPRGLLWGDIDPVSLWSSSDLSAVCLPWVNDNTGHMQNAVKWDSGKGKWVWERSLVESEMSWQPYLCHIIKQICRAIDYSCDIEALENDDRYKYLLICNTLPGAWDIHEFSRALPHWSVTEFFEKLALFLNGEFVFDRKVQKLSFSFCRTLAERANTVKIETVVDDRTVEISADGDACDYVDARNIVYKDCDHRLWKYYSCDWFIGAQKTVRHFASVDALLDAVKPYCTDGSDDGLHDLDSVLHVTGLDYYFILRAKTKFWADASATKKCTRYALQALNLFGGRIVDHRPEADSVAVEFVPAWIDDTDAVRGKCLFLPFSGFDEDDEEITPEDSSSWSLIQPKSVQLLEMGEKEKQAEYYDRIYIGWWDGSGAGPDVMACPIVEPVRVRSDWSWQPFPVQALRLNDHNFSMHQISHHIDSTRKFSFRFLMDSVPDVKSVFIFFGKRYLCEKITATFTENGMSQLLKGDFYQIIDD